MRCYIFPHRVRSVTFWDTGRLLSKKFLSGGAEPLRFAPIRGIVYSIEKKRPKTGEEAVCLADSNITNRALAAALRELLKERPFAQISVTDICDRCEMNRKSFYYHFRDKYDLVNWIYYTEFWEVLRRRENAAGWEVLRDLCLYFEEKRDFYRKTFEVEGQNSFSDYFREIVTVILDDDFEEALAAEEPEAVRFYLTFYADAIVAAVRRWLEDRDPVPAETLAAWLRRCLTGFEPGAVDRLHEAPVEPPGRTGPAPD